MPRQIWIFFRQLIRGPRQIGSVVPSGTRLAKEMARGLGPNVGQVVEIGPGTGVITNQILCAGVPPQNLTLMEMNTAFCDALQARFPKVAVHNQNASAMAALSLKDVEYVISGLPLLNMSCDVQRDIVSATLKTLRKDGTLVQFTYGLRMPIAPEIIGDLGLTWTKSARVWANVPSASVYRFKRQTS